MEFIYFSICAVIKLFNFLRGGIAPLLTQQLWVRISADIFSSEIQYCLARERYRKIEHILGLSKGFLKSSWRGEKGLSFALQKYYVKTCDSDTNKF